MKCSRGSYIRVSNSLIAVTAENFKVHSNNLKIEQNYKFALCFLCSGDPAWDGMQRYLVETGELHNNARMGWGGAIPRWTASPEEFVRPPYQDIMGSAGPGLIGGPTKDIIDLFFNIIFNVICIVSVCVSLVSFCWN